MSVRRATGRSFSDWCKKRSFTRSATISGWTSCGCNAWRGPGERGFENVARYNKNVAMKKFYIETFGCQMNAHDSEKVVGTLASRGYEQVESVEAADLVLYNTCSIRDKAEQKVFHRLQEFKKLAKHKTFAVIGCVAGKLFPFNVYPWMPSLRIITSSTATLSYAVVCFGSHWPGLSVPRDVVSSCPDMSTSAPPTGKVQGRGPSPNQKYAACLAGRVLPGASLVNAAEGA